MLAALNCVLLLSSVLIAPEPKWTVKREKTALPDEVKENFRAVLEEDALVVADGNGKLHCTFWLRREIPMQATVDQVRNGLTYEEIAPTTLIGIVQFPQVWTDFRKQEIPAGTYTIRFVVQPASGDHMGTSPYPEFCLLSAIARDVAPAAMEVKTLVEQSAKSHAANHPAVMLLFPNPKPTLEPGLMDKENGIKVLNLKRTVVAGKEKTSLGFSFVVTGHRKE